MSETTTKNMRNILLYTNSNEDLLSKLKSVNDWKLETDLISGGHKYWLTQGETKVALSFSTSNVAMTSNVLPHDSEKNINAANLTLESLSSALISAGIQNSITASDADLKKSAS